MMFTVSYLESILQFTSNISLKKFIACDLQKGSAHLMCRDLESFEGLISHRRSHVDARYNRFLADGKGD